MDSQFHSPLFESPSIATPGVQSHTDNVLSSLVQQARRDDVIATSSTPKSRGSLRILRLGVVYLALFATPIAAAFGINAATASTSQTDVAMAPASSASSAQDYQQVTPASVTTASTTNDFEYELSLANGFLQKAIKTSNASETQTVEEKNMVIQLLTQALEAANRAVSLAPTDARGYSARGRVYQATSTIKPEMKTLADADFSKATELGSTNPSEAPATQDPMQLLPTEQAAGKNQAMIAAPETASDASVNGTEGANAHKGKATLAKGASEVFVPYASVKADTQLYVTPEKNPENLTLYVKNKEEGVGFTVASTGVPSSPVEITWWEIE